jgi:hypothetical protein
MRDGIVISDSRHEVRRCAQTERAALDEVEHTARLA